MAFMSRRRNIARRDGASEFWKHIFQMIFVTGEVQQEINKMVRHRGMSGNHSRGEFVLA